LVTTISAFTSATQVTLSAANASGGSITGATVFWATDDTAAFQAAVNAAVTWARANSQYAEVVVPPSQSLFYGIAGALSHANSGNAQITLPVISQTADTLTLVIRGTQNSAAIRHWKALVPQTAGSTLISFGVYASAGAQASDINTNGQSAMIGGPTGPNGYGTGNELFSNMMLYIKGLSLLTTVSSQGLTYGAVWAWGIIQCNIRDTGYGTAGIFNLGGTGDYSAVSTFITGESIGIGMPAPSNQNDQSLINVTCGGGYTYGLFSGEHCDMMGCHIFYCWGGLCLVGAWADGNVAGTGGVQGCDHKITWTQFGIEGCTHDIAIIGAGSGGLGPFCEGSIDVESGLSITDVSSSGSVGPGTGLAAAAGEIHVSGTTGGSLSTTSGTPLALIDQRLS